MSGYLLDTDIAIELLRGRNAQVTQRLAARTRDEVFLCTITVCELLFGALRSQNPERSISVSRRFCSAFQIVPFDYGAAERAAAIRADLEARGDRIGAYDMLIAGIALARGCTVATHNVREFGRISGLLVDDWLA